MSDNTLATANNLGVLSQSISRSDSFAGSSEDRVDFYRFVLRQNSDISLQFQTDGTSFTAEVISDVNGDGIFDSNFGSGESISGISNASRSRVLFEPLPQGTYFIRFRTFSPNPFSYNFTLVPTPKPGNVFPEPGNSISEAFNLGELTGTRSVRDYVGELDEFDYYRFSLSQESNVSIEISGATGRVGVGIYADSNNNNIFDFGEQIEGRLTEADSFSTTLSEGNYFILADGQRDSTQYNLDITQVIDLSGNNRLIGTPGRDSLSGLDGNDVIIGLGNSDRLNGGNDNDRLEGGKGNDRLLGGNGKDSLFGEQGKDILFGGSENDRLDGGSENDRLDGGKGNDRITTGSGRDRIIIRRNQGFDRITDFQNNRDKIDLVRISFGQLSFQERRNDVIVKFGRNNILRIDDTNLNAIDRSDFI